MEHVNGGGPQGDVEIIEEAYRGVPLAHNEDVHGHNDGGGIYEERTAQFPRVSCVSELLQTSITGIYFLFLPLLIIYSIFL